MRNKTRQFVVYPYTGIVAEEKLKIVMDRLAELHALIEEGGGDHKFLYSMLQLNEQILDLLMRGEEIRFYKREDRFLTVIDSIL